MATTNIDELMKVQKPVIRKVKRIVIHHSATPTPTTFEDAVRQVNIIRQYHKRKGWADIGYHVVIWEEWLFKGRDIAIMGAHSRGFNSDSIGVCVLGEGNEITDKTLGTLIKTVKRLCDTYDVCYNHVYLHRQLNNTVCPMFTEETIGRLRELFPSIGNHKANGGK